jgi:hypothetical protein
VLVSASRITRLYGIRITYHQITTAITAAPPIDPPIAALVPTPTLFVSHLDRLNCSDISPVPRPELLEPFGVASLLVAGAVLVVAVIFAERVLETVVGLVAVPLIEVSITASYAESTIVAAVLITEPEFVASAVVKMASSCEDDPGDSEEEVGTCRASCCPFST